jgi:hypothetical protein
MNSERIKEIQDKTAYPESISVQKALLKVWNECEHDSAGLSDKAYMSIQQGIAEALCQETFADTAMAPNMSPTYQPYEELRKAAQEKFLNDPVFARRVNTISHHIMQLHRER